MKVSIRAQRASWRDDIELLVFEELSTHGRVAIGTNVMMQTLEENGLIPGPTLTIKNDQAQFLMDELWRCGLRPSEGAGSAGALAAVERHLADMRKLVFDRRAAVETVQREGSVEA